MLFAFGGLTYSASKGILLGRGRGIARLIEGLMEGDQTSWIILGVVVAIAIAWYGIKAMMNKKP